MKGLIRYLKLFQSTLPRGERQGRTTLKMQLLCFNPRSRAGGDEHCSCPFHIQLCFNPRSRAGSDCSHCRDGTTTLQFQSTLPRGERLRVLAIRACNKSFNPRSPRGERQIRFITIVVVIVSIHAPARGATFRAASFCGSSSVSIHAPARGATSLFICFVVGFCVSIHAPARGATYVLCVSI